MKKLLIGAAAAAALLSPAVASADTNAVVGLDYGNTDLGGGDFDRYGFNGGFSHDFSNGWFLQFDGEHSRISPDGIDQDIAGGYGAVHYGTRNDSYAFGGFASFNDFFAYSGTGVGIEGQWYLSNFVLGGSVGYVDFGDIDVNATNLQVDGAYYFTPNFAVNALVGTTDIEFVGSDDEATSYGVGAEYRFNGSPISVSANWRQDEFDGGDVDGWKVGLTFDFGTDSLHDRQTNGPSMQGAENLSDALGGLVP